MKRYSVVVKGYIGKIDRLNRIVVTFPLIEAANKREAKRFVKNKNSILKLKRFYVTEI